MVHFPGLARTRLCIQRAVTWFYQVGFPHSDISGSKPVCGSPKLFAAYRVLHRLLAPRHPPYALSSLTIKLTQHSSEEDLKAGKGESCKPSTPCFSGCFGPRSGPTRHEEASSPFHKTLLSSKNLRFNAPCGLESRTTRCLLHSVVKEHPFSAICFRPERLRARRSAKPVWSRSRENFGTNKKPGDERRANPSISLGRR